MSTRVDLLLRAALLLGGTAFSPILFAQARVPEPWQGQIAVFAQVVTDHKHVEGDGRLVDVGHIKSQAMTFAFDLGLTDRLAFSASLPYMTRKYEGPRPHRPGTIDPGGHHGGEEEIDHSELDDGEYHSGWQDWSVSLRYQWLQGKFALTPFVRFGGPSHDYPFFAHAALGTRQNRLTGGLYFATPLDTLSPNLHFNGSASYTRIEEVLGIRANHSNLNLELAYFVHSDLALRVFTQHRFAHGGLDFPMDFPSRTDELYYNHDRIQAIEYTNAGLGLNYQLKRGSLIGEWMTFLDGRNGHAIHNAATLGYSLPF
jgi:hypothetical protein